MHFNFSRTSPVNRAPGWGDFDMKQTGMLVGNFKFEMRQLWAWIKLFVTLKESKNTKNVIYFVCNPKRYIYGLKY